jgi:hypothetical protein
MPPKESPIVRAVLFLGRTPFGSSGCGLAHGLLRLFPLIERLLSRGHDIRHIRPGGMIRYEAAPLPRGSLPLPGGGIVRKGDRAIILHFDNTVMTALSRRVASERALTRMVLEETRADLRALARLIERGEAPTETRVVWAETLIYPAMGRLGFRVRAAAPGLRTWGARLYLLAIMAVYRADGLDRLRRGRSTHYQVGEAWIAVEDLLRLYRSANSPQAPDHHTAHACNQTSTDEERAVPD